MNKFSFSPVVVLGGGGGGGDEPIGEGDYLVRFIDYDGTILKEKRVDSGGSVTPPIAPNHTDIGLTFSEWTATSTNVTSNLDIRATYTTADGKTMLGLRSTVATGLDVNLYLNKSDGSTLTVDWGDGSANSTFTNTSNFNTGTHTYANYGDYEVKMWISSGSGTYGFGNGTESTAVVGGSTQTQRDMLLYAFVGESVTSIGVGAFYYHYSLTNITIANSVTSIGNVAFRDCYSLTNITIPNSVSSIGAYAFYRCSSLTNIVIPSNVTSIGDYAFNGCYSLTNIVIPNSVTSIREHTFSSCYSLTNITIPSNVKSIGDYAFSDCFSLTNITIPNSVTSIGYWAFGLCYSLTNITIPSNVTSIGAHAFRLCRSLTTYVFERTAGITAIGGTDTFTGINISTKIYVPDDLVATYKLASNWSTYRNYIYPISDKGVTHND